MPVRITVSMPDDIARTFRQRVPSRSRSRFVADAIRSKLGTNDGVLAAACEEVNRDRRIRRLEKEMDALSVPIEEPWD